MLDRNVAAQLGSLVLALTACDGRRAPRLDIQVFGSLRAMMHDDDVGPKVRLADVLGDRHAFGLGALSELRGEVTVLDDAVYLAYPDDTGGARFERGTRASSEAAALLVVAQVPSWAPVELEAELTLDGLSPVVAARARALGFSSASPLPFLVEGTFNTLSWHVVDGRRLPAGASHAAHAALAVRGSINGAAGRLIGFYSTAHHGILTHMGSDIHAHCALADGTSGHVDAVTIARGSRLLLPSP